ncbi:MAG: hypothetical protein ABIH71_06760 [Candidatus Omnitrophota bacterium]
MEIVVNEWLLDYMLPDSTKQQKDFVVQFIDIWINRCDRVLIRRPSPFVNKFYRYWKSIENDQASRKRFKLLNSLLFLNSDKTRIIDDADVQPLPMELSQKVPMDDKYLIELAYVSTDKIVITTDAKLKDKLKDEQALKIYLLEDFIKEVKAN